MGTREFCNAMSTELAGFKSKMYDIISHVETLPALDRQYFAHDVNTLRSMIEDIEDSIRRLHVECPADFSSEVEDLRNRIKEMQEKVASGMPKKSAAA